MNCRVVIILFTLALPANLLAQVGGDGVYSFLNLTTTPRAAALGGKLATIDEPDLGLVYNNPGLLNHQMHNQLAFSYVGYFADVKYGSFLYSRTFGKVGSFALGVTQVNYGSFIEAESNGNITGSFSGADLAFNILFARTFDSVLTFGVNLKPIYSHLASYKSFGISTDLGASYSSRNGLFSAGLVVKNLGTMVKPYTNGNMETLPLELMAGISKKLAHAPFRFVVTLHQLQTWNIHYKREKIDATSLGTDDSNKESVFGRVGNEVLSHAILGVEFTPVRSFYFRVGYNYQRRNELKIEEKVSTVGFSWGLGIRISKFHLSYSQATYHLAGSSKHFAITTDLDDLFGWSKF